MRIVIVDDHWAVREGLRWAFSEHPGVDVVAAASTASELYELLETRDDIDVIVLDIQMEGASGLEALEVIKGRYPDVRVVMLSMHDDPVFVRRSLELGADGYVLKSAGSEELARALDVVAQGGVHLQSEATQALVREVAEGVSRPRLSPREQEVLQLVANGLENKQVARDLGISETTVKTHLRSAFEKLDVRTRSEAVATALRERLIE